MQKRERRELAERHRAEIAERKKAGDKARDHALYVIGGMVNAALRDEEGNDGWTMVDPGALRAYLRTYGPALRKAVAVWPAYDAVPAGARLQEWEREDRLRQEAEREALADRLRAEAEAKARGEGAGPDASGNAAAADEDADAEPALFRLEDC